MQKKKEMFQMSNRYNVFHVMVPNLFDSQTNIFPHYLTITCCEKSF